jgi:hypothetical protein
MPKAQPVQIPAFFSDDLLCRNRNILERNGCRARLLESAGPPVRVVELKIVAIISQVNIDQELLWIANRHQRVVN